VAGSSQDRPKRALTTVHPRERERAGPLRCHLPGERPGPDRGARDPVGRAARHPEVRGRDRARAGGVLQGAERPPRDVGGDAAEAEHGDAWVGE